MRDFSTGEVAVETARLAPKMSTTILPWICLPLTHHAKMPFMQYVRVTHNGRIIVLQSETHTHIIAASTTTEQDVGSSTRKRGKMFKVIKGKHILLFTNYL